MEIPKNVSLLFLIIVLFLFAAVPAWARIPDLKVIQPAAEKGNVKAQNYLAKMYFLGKGVPQNYAEATKWYRKAAEQGDVHSQNALGIMYSNGQGAPKNNTEAVKWYRKAAEQGFAPAQTNLGFMYENGYGTQQNYTEAAKWYRKAAEQGETNAKTLLSAMNQSGRAATKDDIEKYELVHMLQKSGEGFGILIACKMLEPKSIGVAGPQIMKKVEPYAIKNGLTNIEKDKLYDEFMSSANAASAKMTEAQNANDKACKEAVEPAYKAIDLLS